jgi:hypothetical protein
MSEPSMKELRAAAKLRGLDVPFGIKKADLTALLADGATTPPTPPTERKAPVRTADRLPLVRRPSTGEWKCPHCHSPRGANESRVVKCPDCLAVIDGDQVVARSAT